MFLNDDEFKETETWLNGCTSEYTKLLFAANNYIKHYRANTNWPGKAGLVKAAHMTFSSDLRLKLHAGGRFIIPLSLWVNILLLRDCLYDPAWAGRDVFISPRRETRQGGMACLHGQIHCRDEVT